MEPTDVPAVMVEAAARKLAMQNRQDFDRPITSPREGPEADEIADQVRDHYRNAARVLLAAALSACEVREEWRVPLPSATGVPRWTAWLPTPMGDEGQLRWVFTTPAEAVER